MTIHMVEQGSDQWKALRCGSLGASRVADALAKTKTGYGASRANIMAELVAERLTGMPTESFINDAMRWGTEQEPNARAEYELRMRCEVQQVGLILHPDIVGTHASPDGLIGDDGLLEIKAPNTATHLETLLCQRAPTKYEMQMQWQMCCSGRKWCDFVSYDPRLPESMSLFIARVERDDKRIAELEREVRQFLAELDQKVADLRTLYIERKSPMLKQLQASAEAS